MGWESLYGCKIGLSDPVWADQTRRSQSAAGEAATRPTNDFSLVDLERWLQRLGEKDGEKYLSASTEDKRLKEWEADLVAREARLQQKEAEMEDFSTKRRKITLPEWGS